MRRIQVGTDLATSLETLFCRLFSSALLEIVEAAWSHAEATGSVCAEVCAACGMAPALIPRTSHPGAPCHRRIAAARAARLARHGEKRVAEVCRAAAFGQPTSA